MNGFGKWLAGAVSALISGAANAVLAAAVAPETFNLGAGLPQLGSMALGGAILGLAMYLRQSPIPQKWDGKTYRRTGDTIIGEIPTK